MEWRVADKSLQEQNKKLAFPFQIVARRFAKIAASFKAAAPFFGTEKRRQIESETQKLL